MVPHMLPPYGYGSFVGTDICKTDTTKYGPLSKPRLVPWRSSFACYTKDKPHRGQGDDGNGSYGQPNIAHLCVLCGREPLESKPDCNQGKQVNPMSLQWNDTIAALTRTPSTLSESRRRPLDIVPCIAGSGIPLARYSPKFSDVLVIR